MMTPYYFGEAKTFPKSKKVFASPNPTTFKRPERGIGDNF